MDLSLYIDYSLSSSASKLSNLICMPIYKRISINLYDSCNNYFLKF